MRFHGVESPQARFPADMAALWQLRSSDGFASCRRGMLLRRAANACLSRSICWIQSLGRIVLFSLLLYQAMAQVHVIQFCVLQSLPDSGALVGLWWPVWNFICEG